MFCFLSSMWTRELLNATRRITLSKSREILSSTVRRYTSFEKCTEPINTEIRIALPVDFENIIEFMCRTYFKTEPSLVNIGLNCEEPPPQILVNMMQQQIKEGMTLISEDAENCLIGAAVNCGVCPWDADRLIEYAECHTDNDCIRDLLKFYAYLLKNSNVWDKYCILKAFEISAIAIDPRYLKMGIGKRLVEESCNLARDCGYKVLRVDCTSIYTAKVLHRLGWECVFSIPYKRYIDSGGLVFKHVQEPHMEAAVYVKEFFTCKP